MKPWVACTSPPSLGKMRWEEHPQWRGARWSGSEGHREGGEAARTRGAEISAGSHPQGHLEVTTEEKVLRQWSSRGLASYPGPGPTGCAARDNCFTSPRRYPLPCKLRARLCHRVTGKGFFGLRHVKNMIHTGHSRSSKSVPLLLKNSSSGVLEPLARMGF